ncbi:ABC transporter permease subunit [Limnobacter sp.]|uniref:ABC transporter permease subunit n=1 Tax=Limnobacter sp. TaxID=2003368 RepID=UPI002FE1D51C
MDFAFITDPAGFGLSEGWLQAVFDSPYWFVLLAGLLNTLKVALPALLLATLLGLFIGLGQLVQHPLLKALCKGYVNLFRNVPLLLQLLAIYFAITQFLPIASQALSLGDTVFLSKSGLAMPSFSEAPARGRFSVEGGWVLSPEYLAVLLALVVYTAAFVAEVVRSGVQAVKPGMWQGALALGLNNRQVNRHVVLPLALRVMVPSLSNQYLNLLKNASLGVAVGYPELVSVANTAINQSGKAVECVLIILFTYALLSAVAAGLMNMLNARVNRGAL